MAMNVINAKVAVNNDTFEAFEEALRDVGSKSEIFREALIQWLFENGYLDFSETYVKSRFTNG